MKMAFGIVLGGMSLVCSLALGQATQPKPVPGTAAPPAATTAQAKPEDAVRGTLREFADAFNKQDVKRLTACWAEEAVYVDRETGEKTQGRDAIIKDTLTFLKERPAMLAIEVESIRFIKADVAQVDGQTTLASADEDPTRATFTATLVNTGGKWQLDSVQEMPQAAPTSTAALKELSWMVGKWKDDTEGASVETTTRWSAKEAYLIRSYMVQFGDGETHEGTQVIGWDPRQKQIRSWTFDSDGSFGEETWSKSGGEWTVKLARTLSDGRVATGIQVITPVDADTVTFKIVGREIEGEPAPSTDLVKVVRVKDAKASAK